MASNLPPGVTDDQIPGNRPEDLELEAFHEAIDNEIIIKRLTAEQARRIWNMGMAADRGESKNAVQLAIDVLEDHGLYDEAERLANAALRGIEPASETKQPSSPNEDACPLCKARADMEELRSEKNTIENMMLRLSDENFVLGIELKQMEKALRDITDNVIIIHLDANGDHRYALNHRAHRAITRANEILLRGGGKISDPRQHRH